MTTIKSDFSLADITDDAPFSRLGEGIAADPTETLRRVRLSAQVVQGSDGLRRTELITARAIDRVESPASLLPIDTLRQQLVNQILSASIVPARANQIPRLGRSSTPSSAVWDRKRKRS